MSCTTCGQNKCGCQDTPLTTIPQFQCPDNQCPEPSPCDEYYDVACSYYADAGIPDFSIPIGASLQSILQRLILAATGNLNAVTGTCQASFNIFNVNKTTTSITVGWDASLTADATTLYQVEYKAVGAVTWNMFPTIAYDAQRQLTITGLITGTDYLVRVNTICGLSNSYSVTLQIKTN